jgi:nucleotide-binding universal stress UspA family protein
MKDILVQLDGGERSGLRLKVAIEIAQRRNGRVVGLFAQSETDSSSLVARRASEHLHEAAQHAAEAFQQRVAAAGIAGKWLQLTHGEETHVVGETVFCSRYADLVVLGQWHAEDSRVPNELVEQVLLHSGRPALIIPYAGDVASIGQRVAVAWNGSREATRALHDALPLLKSAAEVTVLSIRGPAPSEAPRGESAPMVGIVEHLAAIGVKATAERLTTEDIGVMDLLLSRAFDLGCDLLVMGAHSGLGLMFMRGSGTRFILRHMTMPVLMAN